MKVGDTVGSYRITGKLGEGGMGVVYVGEHQLIGREAAIKVLLPSFCNDRMIMQRFFNEAKTTTSIKHPGIVEIFDFGYAKDGSAYIVMERLEGDSLSDRMKRLKKLDPVKALQIIRQVAGALGAAHKLGVVHRDLKPDNIMMVADPDVAGGERAKILDFGIAKLKSKLDDDITTKVGTVLGAPSYMAPEQCLGAGEVDHRADLYSVGCILFEMLCGRPPFDEDNFAGILAAHVKSVPPAPSALVRDIDPEVERIIIKLLEKDRKNRYRDAESLLVDINSVLERLEPRSGSFDSLSSSPAKRPSAPEAAGHGPTMYPPIESHIDDPSSPFNAEFSSDGFGQSDIKTRAVGDSAERDVVTPAIRDLDQSEVVTRAAVPARKRQRNIEQNTPPIETGSKAVRKRAQPNKPLPPPVRSPERVRAASPVVDLAPEPVLDAAIANASAPTIGMPAAMVALASSVTPNKPVRKTMVLPEPASSEPLPIPEAHASSELSDAEVSHQESLYVMEHRSHGRILGPFVVMMAMAAGGVSAYFIATSDDIEEKTEPPLVIEVPDETFANAPDPAVKTPVAVTESTDAGDTLPAVTFDGGGAATESVDAVPTAAVDPAAPARDPLASPTPPVEVLVPPSGNTEGPTKHVALSITSNPRGATVYQMPGKLNIGTTPLDLQRPKAKGETTYLLVLRDHTEERITLPNNRSVTRAVRLFRTKGKRTGTRGQGAGK